MGNSLFGGGGNGDDSTMMILLVGMAMLCCSSSAVLGYGWYDNWFCDFDANLGRECAAGGGGDGTSPVDSTATIPSDATSTSTSDATSTSDGASASGGDSSGSGGSGDSSGSGGSGDSSKKNKCKDKGVTLELAYLPVSSKYGGKNTTADVTGKGATKSKSVKLNKDFLSACKSQYHCKIDDVSGVSKGVYATQDGKKLVYVGDKPLNSKGSPLDTGVVGVYSGAISGYKQIQINGKGKYYTIGDTLGSGSDCKISLYTGKEMKKPSKFKFDGLEDGKTYKINLKS